MVARILALDVGERRIGVAVSDPLGWTAQGVETLLSQGEARNLDAVRALAARYETDRVLVGLPRSLDGTLGPQAEKIQRFAEALRAAGLKVRFADERLTTKLVTRTLIEGDVSRKKRKDVVDKLAATVILQGFLDAGGWKDERNGYRIKQKGVNDMEEMGNNIVELLDEDGKEVRFEHLYTMEHEGHSYILLVPLEGEGEPGEEEDEEVVILRIDADEDGEETYVGVEDEDLLDAIFARYLEIAEQEEEAEELLEDEEEE